MKDVVIVSADDPSMAGNWHPFPPPEPGFYDLRRVIRSDTNPGTEVKFRSSLGEKFTTIAVYQGEFQFMYYAHRRMHESGKHFHIMSRRVSKMRAQDGWQFRFEPGTSNWRPFVVLYAIKSGQLAVERRVDITGQMPLARSKEEALYIVRTIPQRYPAFWQQHVEYTEEVLQ